MQLRRISHALQNPAQFFLMIHLFSATELNERIAFSLEFPVLNNIYHLQATSLGFSIYGVDVHIVLTDLN